MPDICSGTLQFLKYYYSNTLWTVFCRHTPDTHSHTSVAFINIMNIMQAWTITAWLLDLVPHPPPNLMNNTILMHTVYVCVSVSTDLCNSCKRHSQKSQQLRVADNQDGGKIGRAFKNTPIIIYHTSAEVWRGNFSFIVLYSLLLSVLWWLHYSLQPDNYLFWFLCFFLQVFFIQNILN